MPSARPKKGNGLKKETSTAAMFESVFATDITVGGPQTAASASRREAEAFNQHPNQAPDLSRVHRGGDAVSEVLRRIAEPVRTEKVERSEEVKVVPVQGVQAKILGQRVLASKKPWSREAGAAMDVALCDYLAAGGVPAAIHSFPPVEAFDDVEYELRTPADWLSPHEAVRAAANFASKAAAESAEAAAAAEAAPNEEAAALAVVAQSKAEAAEKAQDAAAAAAAAGQVKALYVDLSAEPFSIKECVVLEYSSDTEKYMVQGIDQTDTLEVPRVLLMFSGENIEFFAERLIAALAKRNDAMRDLQYKLCVKNMPMASKGEVTLALATIDRVLQWTFNTDKLKNGDLDTSNLLIEVYNDYVWTVNKLIFDYKRGDPSQADMFASVEPPLEKVKPVPEFGQKNIPAHDKLSNESSQYFKDTLCIGAPEAILAWSKLTRAKLNVVDIELFNTKLAGGLELASFEDFQRVAFQEMQGILKGYINGVAGDIKFCFREMSREWLDKHEMSFTMMANLTLQDALRDMFEAGIQSYAAFIDSRCPQVCTVNAIDDIVLVKSATAPRGVKPIPPLLNLELIIAEHIHEDPADSGPEPEGEAAAEAEAEVEPTSEPEPEPELEAESKGLEMDAEPQQDAEVESEVEAKLTRVVSFSTMPEQIQEVMATGLFDESLESVQNIPKIDLPYSMEEAFELRMSNNGTMPLMPLAAPKLEGGPVYRDSTAEPFPGEATEWKHIAAVRSHIGEQIEAAVQPMHNFLKLFEPYLDFVNLDVDEYVTSLEKKNLRELRTIIDYHREQQDFVANTFPTVANLGLMSVDCATVRKFISEKHDEAANKILTMLTMQAQTNTNNVCTTMEDMMAKVMKTPANIEELKELREYLTQTPEEVATLQSLIDQVQDVTKELEACQYDVDDNDFARMYEAILWPGKLGGAVESVHLELEALENRFLAEMEGEQVEFERALDGIEIKVTEFSKHSDLAKVVKISEEAQAISNELQKLADKANQFKARSIIFGMEPGEYEKLDDVRKAFEPYAALWVTADTWLQKEKEWLDGPFSNIDADEAEEMVQTSFKTMFKQARNFKNKGIEGCAAVAETLKGKIEIFKPYVPVIKGLRNPGMRDRHWNNLAEKLAIQQAKPFKAIDAETLTLKECVDDMQLHTEDILPTVLSVAEVAGKEFGIEKMLDKMLNLWMPVEYGVTPYRATGTFVIKGTDEINTLLDDHIVATQSMSFSPYKAVFEERINEWEASLRRVQDITTVWLDTQKAWMYLQPIFESEDIMRQLPTEGKKFREADRAYRKILGECKKRPNVLKFCKDEKLLKIFVQTGEDLEYVQKNLNDYLETKRAAFARFYFLSNDELIEILSQTKDPLAVQPHLKKCFEALVRLEFQPDQQMTGMISPEKEYVPFTKGPYPEGDVESWLSEVEHAMRVSVKYEMRRAIEAYPQEYGDGSPRKKWVLAHPGMCVLQGSQTYWTKDLGDKMEQNGTEGVKEYQQLMMNQLKDLTALVRTKLTKLDMKTMAALLVMEVHARDVVANFVRDKVASLSEFDWVSQLRYYWIEDEFETSVGMGSGVIAKMCQCVYPYGYEYLGNSFRLVITPLTDRCYMTLMGAMHVLLGGAPAGPAGTGKTETTKDLAKALSKHCVVFNCSDSMDFLQMAKFFKGLATEGAWACFDEFNRINVEVLSVVAQQVLSIQQCIRRKQPTLLFQGVTIKVDATFNVFITMNPGYAGRTELPDNLKVLFRPMSMMVPDYALIAEIRNFSFGFDNARACSKKLVATFRLSSECLSSQAHYDYGMRAVNTVIQACGLLKLQFPEMDEYELLLRAVRDSNKPKFLKEDITLFAGIISDVFSGTKEPVAKYEAFEAALVKHALANNIQPHEVLLLKCIQLYEMTTVRHGMMLVGPTGGGKTTVNRILQQAITESKGGNGEMDRVRVYPMNPKSITMGQLYGQTDLSTGEWTDGIAAILIRHCSNPNTEETQVTQEHYKWVYFDGPVDAIWIENMNTVLDDNKKLCLNSGEIIQLSETMRIQFEVEDLRHASPATVSRCGMIWVEPAHLVPQEEEPASACPLCTSFLNALPPEVAEHKDKLGTLMDTYLFKLLYYTRRQVKEAVMTVDNNLLKSFFNIQNTYYKTFVPKTEDEVIPKERIDRIGSNIEPWFLFSLVWSIGASADGSGRVNFNSKLNELMTEAGCLNGPPEEEGMTLYDYQFDTEAGKWLYWMNTIEEYSVPRGAGFAEILVPTVDTVRSSFILEQLSLHGFHTLFVGETGTSKTVIIKDRLSNAMPANFDPIFMGFSAQTSANMTQDIIDGKFDKRRQGRDHNNDNAPALVDGKNTSVMDSGLDYTQWGPPLGKQFVIFVDDFNMPACETYDAQPPIELLRTMVDYKGWFDRKTNRFRRLVDLCLCGAMGPPTGGRNPVTPRMLRHFNFVSLVEMADASVALIFNTILKNFLAPFDDSVQNMAEPAVKATIDVYNTVRADLLPTPEKSHYTFNVRDVSKVVQGVMAINNKKVTEAKELVKVWAHECCRVFQDRFINMKDRGYFVDLLKVQCDEKFGLKYDDVVTADRLIYCDFLIPGTDFESRIYEEAPPIDQLQTLVEEYLADYNQQYVPMELVMFGDAIGHVAKISRVIAKPLGNALLLGVGGSGRKCSAKLATAIAEFDIFSIEITKNYRLIEWRDDLKSLLLKAGLDGKKVVFLFDDTQIVEETFLEDINNILNSGEVPNLMKDDELGPIFDKMTPILMSKNIPASKLNLYNQFISRIKENLHLVICMSPIGDAFRNRLRMFPSLVNCCTIDWFTGWPEEALIQVAKSQLEIEGIDQSTMDSIIKMCGYLHSSVEVASEKYLAEMNRHNYVTPTSYLELLKSINALIVSKRGEIMTAISRLQNGLDKLASTNEQVGGLKQMIIEKQPVLEKTLKEVAEQQVVIDEEKKKAAVIKVDAEAASESAGKKAAEVKIIADDAQADLDKALPALDNAVKCLKELQKGDIVEVKGMGKPPAGVKLVLQGVCIMFSVKPVKEKDPDGNGKIDNWHKAAAPMLSNPQQFMDSLINYDKDNIPEKVIDNVSPMIEMPEFMPEVIQKVSKACTAMCTWVRAMHTYYFIARDVEPKRQKLAAAQKELDETNASLKEAQDKLADVLALLDKLEADFNTAIMTKQNLENEVEVCSAKLVRADKLIGGLGGEAKRWTETVKNLKVLETNIIGDVLVSAGTISYLGPFIKTYRSDCERDWQAKLVDLGTPHTPGCNLLMTLMDAVQVRTWNIQGLPSDDFSIANAIIMTNSSRWPLMIDPQGQANKWIRNMEVASNPITLKASDSATTIQRSLENCVQFGRPLIIENVGETMDPLLEPILSNATFKTSTGEVVIKLGDNTVPFHEDFRFYMTTILPNPHYAPEVSVKVALLNFTITPEGLEEQVLNATVEEERPDLAELKAKLVVENAENARKIKELEDKILFLLANSQGDILDDEVLIETLAVSKVTSNEIEEAVKAAETTGKEIDATRELYRPVAYRASILFFTIADLCIIDPMYQYSLPWFDILFRASFAIAEKSDDLQKRLLFCMDAFLFSLYRNVCRSLFEKDKLLFSFNMCVRIRQGDNLIDPLEWRFLLTGASKNLDTPKPAGLDWMTDGTWNELLNMEATLPVFTGFTASLTASAKWPKTFFDSAEPETGEHMPGWQDKLNSLQKMIVLRAIRPDKVTIAIANYVTEHLDDRFVQPPPFDLGPCFEDSNPLAPLVFVLTSGADPTGALINFADERGMMNGKYHAISLGQGQGPIAEALLSSGMEQGHWILLQNCHLCVSWMPTLERIVENTDPEKVNPSYRLWLTSMPSKAFPVSILQNGIKITNEPPKGLRSNMMSAYYVFNDEFMDKTDKPESWRKLLYAMNFYHAAIQERKKFGALGWNIRYEFNDSDKEINVMQLEEILLQNEEIPYRVILILAGNVNYGGRVTDDLDRRTLLTMLGDYITADTLRDDYAFTQSGLYTSPPDMDYDGYTQWIKDLPMVAYPECYGLHENADITCAQNETYALLGSLLSLQPRVTSGGGMSRDEVIDGLAADIENRIPREIPLEPVKRKYPVDYHESMNTVLAQEITRYNGVLVKINANVLVLRKAVKGLVVMSGPLEAIGNAMFNNQVPPVWAAYPSLKPLASWVTDLEQRIAFLQDWIDNGIPNVFWISGFYFPQAFLTGTAQNFARKKQLPIDLVTYDFKVLDYYDKTGCTQRPEDGCIINGPFLEGCRWNEEEKCLDESAPKVLYVPMPCIFLRPEVDRVAPYGPEPMFATLEEPGSETASAGRGTKDSPVYVCPMYKTLARAGTLSTSGHSTNFIIKVELPSGKEQQGHWIKRSVALFCALRD